MKNNYIVDNKRVLDIIIAKSEHNKMIHFFLLEDGTKIKTNNTEMLIECHECHSWHKYRFASRYEQKKYLCYSCRLSGKRNGMYGRSVTDFMTAAQISKWKENIGKSVSGEKNGMYGKPCYYKMTEIQKQQWKDKIRTTFANRTDDEKLQHSKKCSAGLQKFAKKNPEKYIENKRKAGLTTMLKARMYKKTKPEILLENYLIQHNISYDYSCIMGFKDKCFQYDFIIHNKRILIEVQGNYWHGDPALYNEDGSNGKKKLNKIQKNKIERDKLKKKFAEEKKFKLICIWESEINNNDFSKLKEIL